MIADEILPAHEDNLPRRARYGKGAHQLALLRAELRDGQFGDKSHPVAALYHAHECLEAPQAVGRLVYLYLLALTESHQLVAKAMPLVEQPEAFVVDVGRAQERILEDGFARRDVAKELLII